MRDRGMDGWMDGWMRQMDGWMDEIDGWMDGWWKYRKLKKKTIQMIQ